MSNAQFEIRNSTFVILMSQVFIGIGSNEGDRLEHISRALQALNAVRGIRVVQMATILETEPVGGPPQGPYLNTAAELQTTLTPRELLTALQGIERRLGRTPSPQRWIPRPIDLDILLYDNQIIQEPDLVIPHPRMHERRFVLEPLAQLAPDLAHPTLGRTMAALLVPFQLDEPNHMSQRARIVPAKPHGRPSAEIVGTALEDISVPSTVPLPV